LRRRTLILHIIFTVDEINAGKGLDCTRESNRRRDEHQQHQLRVHLTLIHSRNPFLPKSIWLKSYRQKKPELSFYEQTMYMSTIV
ncbi:unnamed protein product, partial [Trichogramma brassicae]